MGARGSGRFFLHPFDLNRTHFELWDLGNGIQNRVGQDIGSTLDEVEWHKNHLLTDRLSQFHFRLNRPPSGLNPHWFTIGYPKLSTIFGVHFEETFLDLSLEGRGVSGHRAGVVMDMNSSGGQLEWILSIRGLGSGFVLNRRKKSFASAEAALMQEFRS